MNYISVATFSEKFGIPERTVRSWCKAKRIDGATLIGKTWNIPEDAVPYKNTFLLLLPFSPCTRTAKILLLYNNKAQKAYIKQH